MYITDIVYLLDVLVVIVYMSFSNCWDYLLLHEDWASVLRTGRGRAGGGGGEVEFLTGKKNSAKKCSWGLKTGGGGAKNACTNFFFFGGGGEDFGVFGAPHAPTRGSRGVGKRYTSSYGHDM